MPDNEPLTVPCPECSPDEPVAVEKIHHRRVCCNDCGTYFDMPPKKPSIEVRLQLSRHGQTGQEKVSITGDELLFVGEERVFDTGEGVAGVQITALELQDGKRVEESIASDLSCIWARAIDEVVLRVTIQKGRFSKSQQISVHGLYEFSVGTEERIGGLNFVVNIIRTRDGHTLKRTGDRAAAKEIRTIYAREPRGRYEKHRGRGFRDEVRPVRGRKSPATELWDSAGRKS